MGYKIKIVIAVSMILFCLLISSCNLNTILQESYLSDAEVLEAPDIDIDEAELQSIEIKDADLKKTFDPETGVLSTEDIRDPFEPFYLEEEEEKNMMILESIYTKDESEYADVVFNEVRYRLEEGNIFQEVYMVQAINEDSVVLLKGDEILTLYLNEMIFD